MHESVCVCVCVCVCVRALGGSVCGLLGRSYFLLELTPAASRRSFQATFMIMTVCVCVCVSVCVFIKLLRRGSYCSLLLITEAAE